MKIKFLIFLLINLPYTLLANQNKEINEYLRNLEKNYTSHKSMSYRVVYKIKSLMAKSVEQVVAEVDLIRNENDKNFGAVIWYKLGDTVEKYYSGNGLYVINHKDKTITTFDLDAGEIDGIMQDIDGDVVQIPFTNPKMITGLNDGLNKLTIRKHPKSNNLKQILVKYPNEKSFENAEMEITFDPKTNEIIKIYSKFKFRGELQTNEWNFLNVQYDKVNETDLSKRFAKYKSYKKVKFQRPRHQFIEQSN